MVSKQEAKEEEKVHHSLSLLARSSVIVFISLLVAKILSYVYRIIIARYFGPEVYGLFSIGVMIAGWFMAFSTFGLNEGVLRYVSLYRGTKSVEKIKYLFNFSVIILTATSVFSCILLYIFAPFISTYFFHNDKLIIFLRIFSFLIPPLVISHPYLATLRAYEKIAWFTFTINVIPSVIKVILIGLFILIGMHNEAVIYSHLIGTFGILVFAYLGCRFILPHVFIKSILSQKSKVIVRKRAISYSWPLFLFAITATIFYWIDSFSLGTLKGAIEVGWYNAAMPIAVLLGIVPELFIQLFSPLIIKEYAHKKYDMIKQLSQQVGKWIFMINFPLFVLLILFPGVAINFIFGPEYLAAENALRMLAAGALISSIFLISNQLLSMIGKSKTILVDLGVASVANILLNYIFIPIPKLLGVDNSNGLFGAGLATLLSMTLLNGLYAYQSYQEIGIIPIRRKMLPIALITLVPLFLIMLIREMAKMTPLIVGLLSLSFIVVYILLLFLTRCFDQYDIRILKGVRKKIMLVFRSGS